jgi:hypothetical protein
MYWWMLHRNRDSSDTPHDTVEDQSDRTGRSRKAAVQLLPRLDGYFTEDDE